MLALLFLLSACISHPAAPVPFYLSSACKETIHCSESKEKVLCGHKICGFSQLVLVSQVGMVCCYGRKGQGAQEGHWEFRLKGV